MGSSPRRLVKRPSSFYRLRPVRHDGIGMKGLGVRLRGCELRQMQVVPQTSSGLCRNQVTRPGRTGDAGMPMYRDLLTAAYDAFNARDIERALAAMHPEVDWPNGMEA